MGYITTIDGTLHSVIESREQIELKMGTVECVEVGFVHLMQNVSISGFEKGEEKTRNEIESVVFMRNNIVKFTN